jgi:hypothetical protein
MADEATEEKMSKRKLPKLTKQVGKSPPQFAEEQVCQSLT